MLSKKNRVNKKEVDEIFKGGIFLNAPNISFKYILRKDGESPKISFIAPKTVAKKAVIRNKLRRLGYRALAFELGGFPAGLIGVFIFKKYQDDVSIIKNEIKTILHKIN